MRRAINPFSVQIVAALPEWADHTALPPGTFREFTLNVPGDVGMPSAVISNWCGGVFIPELGVRGAAAYHGGGEHSVWTDSSRTGPGEQGVYLLDCDARVYVRRCYPVAEHRGVVLTGDGSPTDEWGAYLDDGSPQSKHTYNGIERMPSAWGGGAQGSLVRVGHTGGLVAGTTDVMGLSATWRFDVSKESHDPGDPSIFKLTGSNTYDFGVGRPATINDAPIACIDHVREGWWSTHRTGSGWGDRMCFTAKDGTIRGPLGRPFGTGWAALHHFAADDVVVRLSDDGADGSWRADVWRADSDEGWMRAPLERQDIEDTRPETGRKNYCEIGYMHPRWSTILGCFVGLDHQYPAHGSGPSSTLRVWKITPPPPGERATGTWTATWELCTAIGDSPTNVLDVWNDAGSVNGVFGRFVECPALRAFVWTRRADRPGQMVRLLGM
jgi:hypothetical protein